LVKNLGDVFILKTVTENKILKNHGLLVNQPEKNYRKAKRLYKRYSGDILKPTYMKWSV